MPRFIDQKLSTLSQRLSQVNMAGIYLSRELGMTKSRAKTSPYRAGKFKSTVSIERRAQAQNLGGGGGGWGESTTFHIVLKQRMVRNELNNELNIPQGQCILSRKPSRVPNDKYSVFLIF